ncbi:MAG: acyltransferase [Clostridia bacterium]|nr:acyltransferase [Clostridia bacterium]
MVKGKRNGYIDLIKFLFAIMIADYHFRSGFLPGGFLAVEGFFMISGYFMMKSIEKSDKSESTGISTVKFMYHKYKGLLPILFVSMVIGFVVYAVIYRQGFLEIIKLIPLMLFEIFPLQTAGFDSYFVVGISWYLSSMFLSLAILYPIIRRNKTSVTLTVCPLIALLGYGILCGRYGRICELGKEFLEYSILQNGIIRALAGCSLGCLISEISNKLKEKEFTKFAKTVFTVLEIILFALIVCMMHYLYANIYDYVVVFLLFGLLIIGISGISYTSQLCNPKWSKFLGTASTLIVLNHYCWYDFVTNKFGGLKLAERYLIYAGLVIATCVAVHYLSKLLSYGCAKLFKKDRWVKQ